MKNRRIYFLGILFGLLAIASCKKTTTDPPNTKVSLKNVYTLAGGGPSYADGQGTSAKFFFPVGIATDANGTIYLADYNNYKIRKITASGLVSTIAGSGGVGTGSGNVDGNGSYAQFAGPKDLVVDASGNIYVTDAGNSSIRKITPSGDVTTFAGGTYGYADGTGTNAQFKSPQAIVIDASGNLYVNDYDDFRIRKITPTGVVTTFAGDGTSGLNDGAGSAAQFFIPHGLGIDKQNNLYLADGNRIRKISASGIVTTVSGSTRGYRDGFTGDALFKSVEDIAVDDAGNLYISEAFQANRIRKITPEGVVTTLTGSTVDNGVSGNVDGLLSEAAFNYPKGLAFDKNGVLYVTDSYNHAVRKIAD